MIGLYQFETCPFCRLVRNKLDELGIKYKKISIDESKAAGKLLKLGGKIQVPFLVDKKVKMYESQDIIEYLEKKYGKN